MTASLLSKLSGRSLNELAFLGKRAVHLDYTQNGRFSDMSVSEDERKRLADIHDFHTKATPVPLTVVHGIAPRSGTNYILDLLREHPDLNFDRDALPEIPLLSMAREAKDFQAGFLQRYIGNERSMGSLDFLSHMAHGMLLRPQANNPEGVQGLYKVPHAHHLNLFSALFPSYKLIICVRDGRDVVSSAMKTWATKSPLGRRSFTDYTREWARAAQLISSARVEMDAAGFPYRVVRYEDAFEDPMGTATELAGFIGVAPEKLSEDMFTNMNVRGSSEGGKDGAPDWQRDNVKRDETFKPIGRWQSWDQSKKDKFMKIAGKELEMFDYV